MHHEDEDIGSHLVLIDNYVRDIIHLEICLLFRYEAYRILRR